MAIAVTTFALVDFASVVCSIVCGLKLYSSDNPRSDRAKNRRRNEVVRIIMGTTCEWLYGTFQAISKSCD